MDSGIWKDQCDGCKRKLTFSGLPIYDEEKKEIRYRISETERAISEYLDENYFEFTLSLDGTVTQAEKYDADGKLIGEDAIAFYDTPKIELSVKKMGMTNGSLSSMRSSTNFRGSIWRFSM